LVYFIEIWARGGSMTTAGGGHRKRKTVERGLEDLHGARPKIFVRTGKGWECSVDSVVLVAEWPSRSMEVEIKFKFYINNRFSKGSLSNVLALET
jgi:hypothetical protein